MSRIKDILKQKKARYDRLQKAAENEGKKNFNSYEDDRFWQPKADEQGKGSAIIRFLNEPEGEELPYVMVYSHQFQGPSGKWYIENCRTTIKEADPVQEANDPLWKFPDGSPEKTLAQLRSRKKHYYSNVYIVKDPANPANNGKVKIYKYGQMIRDMIKDAMFPEIEGVEPVEAYCAVTGTDFAIAMHKEKGRRTYKKSQFVGAPYALGDESKVEEILSQCQSLEQFTKPENFKSYDELQKALDRAMGQGPARRAVAEADEMANEPAPRKQAPARKKPADDEEDDIEAEIEKILADED